MVIHSKVHAECPRALVQGRSGADNRRVDSVFNTALAPIKPIMMAIADKFTPFAGTSKK
jgi:hypothetical protein